MIRPRTLTWTRVFEQLDDVAKALRSPEDFSKTMKPVEQRAVIATIDKSRDLQPLVRLNDEWAIPIYNYIDFKRVDEECKFHTIAGLRNCEVLVLWVIDVLELRKIIIAMQEKTGFDVGSLVVFSDRAYVGEQHHNKVVLLVNSWSGTR